MNYINNINILKNNYAGANEFFRDNYDKENKKFFLEENSRGYKTIYFKEDNKKNYIHSKYNSINEADIIVDSYEDINDGDSLIFYGTGLGYHIEKIVESNPSSNYFIMEPFPELINLFLETIDLSSIYKNKLMGLSIGDINIGQNIDKFLNNNKKNLKIITLPSHIKYFKENYKLFSESLLTVMESKSDSLAVNYSFQERWIINSIKNFKYVLNTPNILREKFKKFEGETAILVAAGPSLNYEVENLKKIKTDRSAYIFSVGSAINTLLYHDIYPDIVTSYDPKVGNQKVIEIIKERNIKSIPILFGSSIGYETIIDYPGEMCNVITSQDSISNYYLQDDLKNQVAMVADASSIAVITLQILVKLGFSKIIFVGQNLAYIGNKQHSMGINYSKDIGDDELDDAIIIESVDGGKVRTSESYNSMRKQIEYYISKNENIKFYNTTKDGAKIEGAEYIELENLIENELRNDSVDKNWLRFESNPYNKEKLDFYKRKMDREYKNLNKIFKEYNRVLDRIRRLAINKNFSQIENMYAKQDRQLRKLENNDFFKVFILPMNRVEYKLLTDEIDRINMTTNPFDKANMVYNKFKLFITACEDSFVSISEDYNNLNISIENYLSEED